MHRQWKDVEVCPAEVAPTKRARNETLVIIIVAFQPSGVNFKSLVFSGCEAQCTSRHMQLPRYIYFDSVNALSTPTSLKYPKNHRSLPKRAEMCE